LFIFATYASPTARTKPRSVFAKATSGVICAINSGASPVSAYDLKFEELKRDRLILGSPAEVVEQVMAYHDEFGAEVMWFMVDWPGMDPRLLWKPSSALAPR